MISKFDSYTINARIFPAIINAIPLLVLWYFIRIDQEWANLGEYLLNIEFFETVTVSFVLLYFFAQLIRYTSKYFENLYFVKARGFPTTYLYLYSDNTLSKQTKNLYREKIKQKLNVDLPNETEEAKNPDEARKALNDITKRVILSVGDGKLVLKHNVWYGFARNLVGGTIYAIFLCVFNICISYFFGINYKLLYFSLILLFFVYLPIFFFKRKMLFQNSEAYAKQLIGEFMNS